MKTSEKKEENEWKKNEQITKQKGKLVRKETKTSDEKKKKKRWKEEKKTSDEKKKKLGDEKNTKKLVMKRKIKPSIKRSRKN